MSVATTPVEHPELGPRPRFAASSTGSTPLRRPELRPRLRLVSAASRTQTVDAGRLRALGAAMLGMAAVRPLFPIQPGLPCPLRTLTGVPCPFCGMTRAVTDVVHGEIVKSLAMNPAGILAVAIAIVLLLAWRVRKITYATWLIPVVFALMWSYQLFKYATGRPL